MMSEAEIRKVVALGEDSRHQFKREMRQPESLAAEMVAFSNSDGGTILIGVNDDGTLEGIPAQDKARLNQLIASTANDSVRPPVYPQTAWFQIDGKDILLVELPSGVQKPYCDRRGRYWVKVGSDKRAAAPEELFRIFQHAQRIYLDELAVPAKVDELDKRYFIEYLDRHHSSATLSNDPAEVARLLGNMKLAEGEYLNLAGLLLFGKNPQLHRPYCKVKAVAFQGTSIADTAYDDKDDISGNLEDVYMTSMLFLRRNLRKVQPSAEFNQQGKIEVSDKALSEALVNALLHRDYGKIAPIRLLIFADRIEVISPGRLPNHLTLENIKAGNTVQRNPTITSFGTRILPYTGLGSGVRRILAEHPDTEFINDVDGEEFKVIFKRPVR
jgi:ATP-dependent DNA helicase RecG